MLLVLEPRCEQQRPRMRLSVGQREDACYDPPGVNDLSLHAHSSSAAQSKFLTEANRPLKQALLFARNVASQNVVVLAPHSCLTLPV